MIFSIDPGNIESAYVLVEDDTLKPIELKKIDNYSVLIYIDEIVKKYENIDFCIEMIASYGMPVGAEVFETCLWIGRYIEKIQSLTGKEPTLVFRREVKINLCESLKANDSNIIQALIDRFAPNTSNKGKGTKKNQGWFYGFSKDIWQSYAVAVTYSDKKKYTKKEVV